METMRISQLAERSGVAPSALRYYEARGLLPAHRSPGGYRLYGRDAVDQLAFIATGKRLGLGLGEIAELLTVWRDEACSQVRSSLRPRIAQRITAAQARAGELAEFTATLRRALEHLDSLPDRPDRCGPECGFPDLAAGRGTDTDPPPLRQDRDAPVAACSLDSAGAERRIHQWRVLLDGAQRETTPTGLRVSCPAGRAPRLAELAAAEQRCCAFFSVTLTFAHDTVHLDVEAPAGARHLLHDVFGAPSAVPDPEETSPC
ncbi:MerR family transcriptional regulator [Marinitenerispora sediminis]|uniref:MerR family transcriptional regulator n=1 Tax=Marinitenerispora sediminis TaxID=1931232 RepID=A0A368T731_9ACTN|nr:MerR family transcriptional regulator [Marinitenerispora sediminis]RCV49599.1 MerR family transcriptional regulator [Marinitenerispora sediminis]RCV53055.1 MerR family transcriptional regulator [Marinitenerispora sediminis]RCV59800.1 MerR family transcriptional regulator [Marinitenerispora sediminis]